MFHDKLQSKLNVGDLVAYVYCNYPDVRIGRIVAFTPKKVRIEACQYTVLKNPEDIVKVTIPDA